MITRVPVSTARDSSFSLHVLAVDLELRLYRDEGVSPVFDARNVASPLEHSLHRQSTYYLRYNNNDGGAGVLHVQVREQRTGHIVRYEVNRSAIAGPEVIELLFSLSPDAAVSPPV